jgi:hypothetical protein
LSSADPGVCAETTALRDQLGARGIRVSEAMCFGLGGGLDFSLRVNADAPTRVFEGRAEGIFARASRRLGGDALAWTLLGSPRAPDPECTREAVRVCGKQMLAHGVKQLERFVADLPSWPVLPDFQELAMAGFEAVQRETGGGLFRALFAQFLDEVGAPELKRVAHGYRELAWGWGELATAMRLASRDGAWDGLPEHAARLAETELGLATLLLSRG